MAIDVSELDANVVPLGDGTVRSPRQWRDRLEKQLDRRATRLTRYDEYYSGEQSLRFATEKFRKAFGFLFREFADNFCGVIVDSLSERLRIEGIRLGEEQTRGDKAAWTIWQRNGLDADSEAAHTEAFVKEQSYGLVWWDGDSTQESPLAQITIEDPSEMIVEAASENRSKRLAAFKKWLGDDGFAYCTLYLPDQIFKWISRNKVTGLAGSISWVQRQLSDENWPLPNKLGVVPVVPLQNKPRLRGPVSELRQVIPLQDFLNKIMLDAAVASEYGAFRQRWAAGLQVPVDDQGKPIEDLKQALDRVWTSKDSNTRFGSFDATDLGNYVKLIDLVVQHIAVQTRTPQHYFGLSGQFPSGDALKAAEAPLVRKAQQRALHFGEAWEEILRLAFLVEGDQQKAAVVDSEMIWGDFEIRNEAQLADSLTKLQTLGFPQEYLWARAGASPQDIERFKQMKAEEPPPAPSVIRETLTGPIPPVTQEVTPVDQQTQTQTGG